MPKPTWGNHIPIMQNAGLEVKKYRYYDASISGLEFDNMIQDLKSIPGGTVVLLHACAHNVSFNGSIIQAFAAIVDTHLLR